MKKQIDNLKSHTDKAPYYDDRHHWSKMSDTWYDIVNQFILDKRLVIDSLLDVGCGTGLFIQKISKSGNFKTLYGIDGNKDMLEIARKKIPDVTLTLLDMRSFDLKRTFDLVTCQYSVLNYLTAEGDLVKALQCIRKHMAAGSWFLFDINSLNGLMNAGELVTIKSSEVIIINSDFNISTRIATLTTEGFFKRPDGLYERMVYVEDERGWHIDELEQIFSNSDFSPFEYLYTSNNKSPNELENEWRLFISVQAI